MVSHMPGSIARPRWLSLPRGNLTTSSTFSPYDDLDSDPHHIPISTTILAYFSKCAALVLSALSALSPIFMHKNIKCPNNGQAENIFLEYDNIVVIPVSRKYQRLTTYDLRILSWENHSCNGVEKLELEPNYRPSFYCYKS